MSTHTIEIPEWVDADTIDWHSGKGGVPNGTYERELHSVATLLAEDGDEVSEPFTLVGYTDEPGSFLAFSVGDCLPRFTSPAQAREFAAALNSAADEWEHLAKTATDVLAAAVERGVEPSVILAEWDAKQDLLDKLDGAE